MKKIVESWRRRFSWSRIDLTDYYAIVDLLEKNCASVEIQADDYVLDDAQEIERLGKSRIYNLEIISRRPSLSLYVRRTGANLHISDPDDLTSMGLGSKVSQILENPRRRVRMIVLRLILEFLGCYVVVMIIQLFLDQPIFQQLSREVRLGIWTTVFVSLAVGELALERKVYPAGILFVRRKNDVKPLYTRHKSLIDLIAAAIVGAVLTLFGQWLLKKL
jgi:hypothetical protein